MKNLTQEMRYSRTNTKLISSWPMRRRSWLRASRLLDLVGAVLVAEEEWTLVVRLVLAELVVGLVQLPQERELIRTMVHLYRLRLCN